MEQESYRLVLKALLPLAIGGYYKIICRGEVFLYGEGKSKESLIKMSTTSHESIIFSYGTEIVRYMHLVKVHRKGEHNV